MPQAHLVQLALSAPRVIDATLMTLPAFTCTNSSISAVVVGHFVDEKLCNVSAVITFTKDVVFVGILFVCLLAGLCKTTLLIFTRFDGKVAHGPWMRPLDFGGNPATLKVKGKGSSIDIAPLTILDSGALQLRKWQLIGTGCSTVAQASGCP